MTNKILERALAFANTPAKDFIMWRGGTGAEPWCADFASTVFQDVRNVYDFNRLQACNVGSFKRKLDELGFTKRQANVGVARPGDIIITDTLSHVTIAVEQSGSTVKTYGGNQGNQGKGDNWNERPDYANFARTSVTVYDMSRFDDAAPTPPAPAPTGWTAQYQAALGGIAVDDKWGAATDKRANQSPAGLRYKTPKQTRVIQRRLGLTEDGVFGAKTELAVKNFQGLHRLRADGVVGALTAKAMFA